MKPEITLSPNEIDRLLETEEKQKRLKRLQEVRIQEKQLSLQRVKQFKAEMKSEWENVVVSLERDFEIKKQQELEYLNTIYEGIVNEEVGKAFKDAEMERRMEVNQYATLLESIAESQQIDQKRFESALSSVQSTLKSRENEILLKTQNRLSAIDYANQRSKKLTEKYKKRDQERGMVEVGLQSLNQSIRSMKRGKENVKYEETYFHRQRSGEFGKGKEGGEVQYHVVRCEQGQNEGEEETSGKEFKGKGRLSANEMAERERLNQDERDRMKKAREEELERKTRERSKKAFKDVFMEKERLKIHAELEQVSQEDQKRRQTKLGEYISNRQQDVVPPKQSELQRQFEKMFIPKVPLTEKIPKPRTVPPPRPSSPPKPSSSTFYPTSQRPPLPSVSQRPPRPQKQPSPVPPLIIRHPVPPQHRIQSESEPESTPSSTSSSSYTSSSPSSGYTPPSSSSSSSSSSYSFSLTPSSISNSTPPSEPNSVNQYTTPSSSSASSSDPSSYSIPSLSQFSGVSGLSQLSKPLKLSQLSPLSSISGVSDDNSTTTTPSIQSHFKHQKMSVYTPSPFGFPNLEPEPTLRKSPKLGDFRTTETDSRSTVQPTETQTPKTRETGDNKTEEHKKIETGSLDELDWDDSKAIDQLLDELSFSMNLSLDRIDREFFGYGGLQLQNESNEESSDQNGNIKTGEDKDNDEEEDDDEEEEKGW